MLVVGGPGRPGDFAHGRELARVGGERRAKALPRLFFQAALAKAGYVDVQALACISGDLPEVLAFRSVNKRVRAEDVGKLRQLARGGEE